MCRSSIDESIANSLIQIYISAFHPIVNLSNTKNGLIYSNSNVFLARICMLNYTSQNLKPNKIKFNEIQKFLQIKLFIVESTMKWKSFGSSIVHLNVTLF